MIGTLRTALFGRKKPTQPFKDYYPKWFNTLKNNLLPRLRRSLLESPSSFTLFFTHVEAIHNHFQAYYDTLDLAASDDVAQVLFPEWRTTLEKPFLWFGDLHPYIFTNLLRSFLEEEEQENTDQDEDLGAVSESKERPYQVGMTWKGPGEDLTAKIEEIERGLRLMVHAVVARARNVQESFVERVGAEWIQYGVRKDERTKAAVEEAVMDEMEEMLRVVLDANRLRKSVLTDILNATNVHQAALFLERLSQFLVGFRDHGLMSHCDHCKTTAN